MTSRNIIAFLTASLILVGAGCTRQITQLELPTAPPSAEAPGQPPGASTNDTGTVVINANAAVEAAPTKPGAGSPYYVAYTEAQYVKARGDGRPILLYFWASWCPICLADEPKTKSIVETMDVPVAGFRVNYDTEKELKKRFRVPYQHTIIILDASGEETARFTGPVSDADLREAIRAAAK